MAVKPLDSLTSNPVAFAQSVVDEKQLKTVEGAQAKLAKDQLDSQGKVVQTLLDGATDTNKDGRRLLAKA